MTRTLTIMLVCIALLALTGISEAQIIRSTKARRDFRKQHPCPATGKTTGRCQGYIIDHIIPLACGGPDHPDNMQWQTYTSAKRKNTWERKRCMD